MASATFGADAAHVRWFGARVISAAAGLNPARVLDVGCGDGSLILHLAEALPEASFVGVDLAAANIANAVATAAGSPHRDRLTFIRADYLMLDAGYFDLIVASSSLQGMDAPLSMLAAKLAHDAAAGARLVHVTPYRCAYNNALNILRRGLRVVRGAATDRMILEAAHLLHPEQPVARLRERVDYMYLVLRHYEDDVRAALLRRRFELVGAELAPHTSPGQPKHRLAVMSAPAAGGVAE